MTTVLVTGATGNVGASVVRELSGRDVRIRAFVRDPAKATRMLPEGVEQTIGDFSDRASVRRAMEGVDLVFLASGDSPEKVDYERAVINEASAADVKRIVKASTVGAAVDSPLPPLRWHGLIEEHLLLSGVPARSCAPTTT